MRMRFGETVTVRRYSRDAKGNRTLVSEHTIPDCGIAAAGGSSGWGVASDENNVRGETVTDGLTLYGPYGADVTARDVVVLANGDDYEVDGSVARWHSPLSSWAPGVVVNLKRVNG